MPQRKLSLNPIYASAIGRPQLADDLQWNFDEIQREVLQVRYSEKFTATGQYIVTHSLDIGFPQVTVYNSAGTEVKVIVTHLDNNTVRLNFTSTLTDATVVVNV